MEKKIYLEQMKKLELFCNFKPTKDHLVQWYEALHLYTNKEFVAATESLARQGSPITYKVLKDSLASQSKKNLLAYKPVIDESTAVDRQVTRRYMQKLVQALKDNNKKSLELLKKEYSDEVLSFKN